LNGQPNVAITYFDTTGNPLPSPLPNPFPVNTATTITVRVTNTITQASDGPCYDEETLQFIVDVLPQAFPVNPALLQICDDETDPLLQDGKYAFDTSTFETSILNGQTGLTVEYFDGNTHALPSPLPNPFITGTQNVTVIVENPINKTCPATLLLPFVVHPTPKINLLGDELVCTNLPSFFKTLYADIVDNSSHSNYTYQWYLNGALIPGATAYSIDINAAGTYSVDVTTIPFGCARTRTITVVSSDMAHLDNIIITDLTESATHNTVQIIASGTGDLVYGLDSDTDLQPSNLFTDVEAGVHEVYIKDMNGCGIVGPIEIYVLGIPNFFSPNTDGFNDTWNIKGINDRFNKNSVIHIFDRNGKLLKEMAPTGKGWDGTFNGRQLPADDYWYSIKLEDNRVFEGHFSLIR
jgi:gliding motility-associated-like protein